MTSPKLSREVSKCSKTYRETGRLYVLPTSTAPLKLRFAQAQELLENNKAFPSITNVLSVADGDFSGWHTRMMGDLLTEELLAGRTDFKQLMKEGSKAAAEYRDNAAARGTEVHAAIEDRIDGLPPKRTWDHSDGPSYFNAFKEFEKDFKPNYIMQEVTAYGKTATGKYYAGTLDCLAEINGEICLIDWKCVKSVKSKVAMQLAAAAYATVYADRETGELKPMPKIDKAYACQLTPHGYHLYEVQDLEFAWHNFQLLREAWEVKVFEGGAKDDVLEEVIPPRRTSFNVGGTGEQYVPVETGPSKMVYDAPNDGLAPVI